MQDQWTHNRLTLQGAVRYEHAWSWFPGEGENGILAPTRYNAAPIVFPQTDGVKGFNDITPRMGVAYDVFGNGKTSFKASFSKYLQPANNESVFTSGNPSVSFAAEHRSQLVRRRRRLRGRLRSEQPERPTASAARGPTRTSASPRAAPRSIRRRSKGWGSRPYDWQFAVSVQQEMLPRVSAEVSYNRRSWGNFYYTDNRAVGPTDFDTVTITAPRNPILPGRRRLSGVVLRGEGRQVRASSTTTSRSPRTTAT